MNMNSMLLYVYVCETCIQVCKISCLYLQIYMSIQLRQGSLCISFQTGLPQTQSDENTVLQYHIHPFILFKATEFLRFFHTGIEYQHIQQLHIYYTIKLITFSFIQITQHEPFPTCHTAERSYCFIAIHHYRYDGLYCQCSPRLRHTLTICFALYCFLHFKQVIQNLFFLVSKYTLAISLNDFMWIKTQVLLAWKNFPVLFSRD